MGTPISDHKDMGKKPQKHGVYPHGSRRSVLPLLLSARRTQKSWGISHIYPSRGPEIVAGFPYISPLRSHGKKGVDFQKCEKSLRPPCTRTCGIDAAGTPLNVPPERTSGTLLSERRCSGAAWDGHGNENWYMLQRQAKNWGNFKVYPQFGAKNPTKTGTCCSERPKTGGILKSTPHFGPKMLQKNIVSHRKYHPEARG